MKSFKSNQTLVFTCVLLLSIWSQIVSAVPEIKRAPIMFCTLNKSYTLEIYKETSGEDQFLVMESKSFLETIGNGQKIVHLNLNRVFKVEYGDVLMYTFDLGRGGYFFMHIDKRTKPSDTDHGNATLHYDNNLFQEMNKPFFTNGHMKLQPDCNYLEN